MTLLSKSALLALASTLCIQPFGNCAKSAGDRLTAAAQSPQVRPKKTERAPEAGEPQSATGRSQQEKGPASDPLSRDAIRIETNLVNLNIKAVDRNGQPIVDLKPEDFEVFEDGVKQEILHFENGAAALNLVLLLDMSGSTKEKRDVIAAAAKKFVDLVKPNDRLAITAFTSELYQLSAFTADRKELRNSVDKIKNIEGGTAFYDSLWKTLDLFEKVSDDRKVIVVLSDGEDDSLLQFGGKDLNKSKHTFDELLARILKDAVTIYPIHLEPVRPKIVKELKLLLERNPAAVKSRSQDRTENSQDLLSRFENARAVALDQLQTMADQTAGAMYRVANEHEVNGVYQRVAAELRHIYSLAYSPDKSKAIGEFRRITVKINRDGAVAATRKGYYDHSSSGKTPSSPPR